MDVKKFLATLTSVAAAFAITTANASAVVDVQLGDVNFDGKVNVRDCAAIALKLAQRKAEELPLAAADFNVDGVVNIRDASSLAMFLASGYAKTPIRGNSCPLAMDWTGKIISNFGYNDNRGETEFNTGVEFATPHGTEVLAIRDGIVANVFKTCDHDKRKVTGCGCNNNKGNEVSISTKDGLYVTYTHLSSVDVKVGDKVKNGQVVGKTGATGWSREDNLHLEIRVGGKNSNPVNPLDYIKNYSPLKG